MLAGEPMGPSRGFLGLLGRWGEPFFSQDLELRSTSLEKYSNTRTMGEPLDQPAFLQTMTDRQVISSWRVCNVQARAACHQ